MTRLKIHRKNTSSLLDRLVVCFGVLFLALSANVAITEAGTPAPWTGDTCDGKLDLMLIVDASWSIGKADFATVLSISDSLIDTFESILPSDNKFRVGVIIFASQVYDGGIPLTTDTGQVSDILDHFNRTITNTDTNTHIALERARQLFLQDPRANVTRIAVLITDGVSNNPGATAAAAQRLKGEGVHVVAMGHGEHVNIPELETISSDSYLTYTTLDASLATSNITDAICTHIVEQAETNGQQSGTKYEVPVDVVFLLDQTTTRENYELSKDFIEDIMQRFQISSNFARGSVINYGTGTMPTTTATINLRDGDNEAEFYKALNDLSWNRFNTRKRHIGNALRTAYSQITGFQGSQGRESVIVLLSTGLSDDDTSSLAQQINASGTTRTLTVGIGQPDSTAWAAERASIAHSAGTQFMAGSHADLGNDAFQAEIATVIEQFASGTFGNTDDNSGSGSGGQFDANMDVVFVLDVSGAQGLLMPITLTGMKTLVIQMIKRLTGDGGSARVGVILFDDESSQTALALGQVNDATTLINRVSAIRPHSNAPTADNAIALEALVGHMNAKARADASRIGILITKSVSGDEVLVQARARQAARNKIRLLTIGFEGASQNELEDMQLYGDQAWMTSVADVTAISPQLSQELERLASTTATGTVPVWDDVFDLMVLVPEDGHRGAIPTFLVDLLSRFRMSRTGSRAGLIIYGDGVREVVGLQSTINNIITKVMTMTPASTDGPVLSEALQMTRDIFQASGRTDPNVKKLLLLFLGDLPLDGDSVLRHLYDAKTEGISTLVYGAGSGITETTLLESMAYSEAAAFRRARWEDAKVDPVFESAIVSLARGIMPPHNRGLLQPSSTGQCSNPASVVFLLDSSESITDELYTMLKEFIAGLLSRMNLDKMEVGIVAFATLPLQDSILEIGAYRDLNFLYHKLLYDVQQDPSSRGTGIAEALYTARLLFDRRNRVDPHQKLIVLITDARSNVAIPTTVTEANDVRAKGIKIFGIGAGSFVAMDALAEIAGGNENVREIQQFDLSSELERNTVSNLICQRTLQTAPATGACSTILDLVIVLDASRSITVSEFFSIRLQLREFVKMLTIGLDKTRVGVIAYSNEVHTGAIFHLYQSDTSRRVEEIGIFNQKKNVQSSGTVTGAALLKAIAMLQDNRREAVHQVILCLTDGASTNTANTLLQADAARRNHIHVVAVGYGKSSSVLEAELYAIATDPASVYYTPTVAAVQKTVLMELVCPDNYVCTSSYDVFVIYDIDDQVAQVNAAQFVDDLRRSFSLGDLYTVELGSGSLQDAITGGADRLVADGASTSIHLILIITDNYLNQIGAVNAAATDAKQRGILIGLIDVAKGDSEAWIDVVSDDDFRFDAPRLHEDPYSTYIRRSFCQDTCTDGSELNVNGRCTPCIAGYYRRATASYQCQACPAGKATPGEGAIDESQCTIADCPKGTKRKPDESGCTECPKGTYQDQERSTECKQCPAGQSTDDVGATDIQTCVRAKCSEPLDIVVVVDGTANIQSADRIYLKLFLFKFIDSFVVGLDDVRISIVCNGESVGPNERTLLADSTSNVVVKDAVNRLSKGGASVANTGIALEAMINIFESDTRDKTIPRFGLLLHAGESGDLPNARKQAERAKILGIEMFALGIGADIPLPAFTDMVSQDQNLELVTTVQDLFDTTSHDRICNAARLYTPPIILTGDCQSKMDIVICIDASRSITLTIFNNIRLLLTRFVQSLDIQEEKIRVAILSFSQRLHTETILDLSDSTSGLAVIAALYRQRLESSPSNPVTHEALEKANSMLALEGREDAYHVAMVITDEQSTNPAQTLEEATKLRDNGVLIVAVGFDNAHTNPDEIQAIATDENSFITTPDINNLEAEDLVRVSCEDQFECRVEMEILFLWDIKDHFDRAERFVYAIEESFPDASFANIFVQSGSDVLDGISQSVNALQTVWKTYSTSILVLLVDRPITDPEKALLETRVLEGKEKGIIVVVINLLESQTDLSSVASNSDLAFNTKTSNDQSFAAVIRRALCIEPCTSGNERAVDGTCSACEEGFFRDTSESKTCLQCPPDQTTDQTGSTSMNECRPRLFCEPGTKRSIDGTQCILCPEDEYQPSPQQGQCIPCPVNLFTEGTGAKELSECIDSCATPMDIIFNIDASISIAAGEFAAIKAFLTKSIERFRISDDDTKIGIVSFGRGSSVVTDLSASDSRAQLISELSKLTRYADSGTDTGLGLQNSMAMLQSQGRSVASGKTVKSVIVTVTDGRSTIPADTIEQSEKAREEFTASFVYGVGANVYAPEIYQIATGQDSAVFIPSFFQMINEDVLSRICDATFQCSENIDLFFIWYSQSGLGVEDEIKTTFSNSFSGTITDQSADADIVGSLEGAIDSLINGGNLQANPAYGKVAMIAASTPLTATEVIGVQQKAEQLKALGVVLVVAVPDAVVKDSFEEVPSSTSFMFETDDIVRDITFIKRAVCLAPCPDGSERNSDGECAMCYFGEFRAASLTPMCEPCGPGTSTDIMGATSASDCFSTSCIPGQWKCGIEMKCIAIAGRCDGTEDCGDGTDEALCADCDAGTKWNEALKICQECEAGTYQPLEDQESCIACPPYTTTGGPKSTAKTDCNDPCDRGSQLESDGLCKKCSLGFYKDELDIACIPCRDRHTTEREGALSESECVPDCETGEFWLDTAAACVKCPVGTFQPLEHALTCNDCDPGTTTPGVGADDASACFVPCPPGEGFVGDKCVPCATGTFRSATEKTCTPCSPAAFTTKLPGSTSRTDCVPNCIAGEGFGASTCEDCDIGTFSSEPYQYSCRRCIYWKTTAEKGSTSEAACIDRCESGYQWAGPSLGCSPCPRNYFRTKGSTARCEECPAGFQTLGTGTKFITQCLAYCASGSKWDSASCVLCPRGTYQPLPYQLTCDKCPDGKTTLAPGATSETSCIGDCKEGQRWDDVIKKSCVPCEPGTFQDQPYQDNCKNCKLGLTSPEASTSAAQCFDPCGAGGVFSQTKQECNWCSIGTFRDPSRSDECESCPEGHTTTAIGTKEEKHCVPDCQPGFSWSKTTNRCEPCQTGTYQPQAHQYTCQACPYGTTLQQGATTVSQCIDPCGPGMAWNPFKNHCNWCKVGFYKNPPEDKECKKCEDGFTTLDMGMGSKEDCKPDCQAGTRWTTSNKCEPCPKGTFQPEAHQYNCKLCPYGTTKETGSDHVSKCIDPCGAGMAWNPFKIHCNWCKVGFYKNPPDDKECQKCPDGFTTLDMGMGSKDDCKPGCSPGTKWEGTTCVSCPKGTYQEKSYQFKCEACPARTTTEQEGATDPQQCIDPCGPGGVYDKDKDECNWCAIGTYKDPDESDICISCGDGLTTLKIGGSKKSDCVRDCKEGMELRDGRCTLCPVGTYKDDDDATCQPCPDDTITKTTGATSQYCCIREPCDRATDIIINVDMPKDLTSEQFGDLKDVLEGIVRRLDVSLKKTRVGIIEYARNTELVISPKASTNEARVMYEIRKRLARSRRYTDINTHLALKKTKSLFLYHGRRYVGKRVITLLNRPPSDAQAAADAAERIMDHSILVAAVGFGTAVSQGDLTPLASNASYAFYYDGKPTPEELDELVAQLCPECNKREKPGNDHYYYVSDSKGNEVKKRCKSGTHFVQTECKCIAGRKKRRACRPVDQAEIVNGTIWRTMTLGADVSYKSSRHHSTKDSLLASQKATYVEPIALGLMFRDSKLDAAYPQSVLATCLDKDAKSLCLQIMLMNNSQVHVLLTKSPYAMRIALPYEKNAWTNLMIVYSTGTLSGRIGDIVIKRSQWEFAANVQEELEPVDTRSGRSMTNRPFRDVVKIKLFSGCIPMIKKSPYSSASDVQSFSIDEDRKPFV